SPHYRKHICQEDGSQEKKESYFGSPIKNLCHGVYLGIPLWQMIIGSTGSSRGSDALGRDYPTLRYQVGRILPESLSNQGTTMEARHLWRQKKDMMEQEESLMDLGIKLTATSNPQQDSPMLMYQGSHQNLVLSRQTSPLLNKWMLQQRYQMRSQSGAIPTILNLVESSMGICIRHQPGLKGDLMGEVILLIVYHDRRDGAHKTLNLMVALSTTEPLTRERATLNGNNRNPRDSQTLSQRVIHQLPTQEFLKEVVHTRTHTMPFRSAADHLVATLNQHHTNQEETIHNLQGDTQMMPSTTFHLGDPGQESPRSK
ncbi:MAG: hypothetical protein ACRCZI_10525, partial [Cetobacterium sp.]